MRDLILLRHARTDAADAGQPKTSTARCPPPGARKRGRPATGCASTGCCRTACCARRRRGPGRPGGAGRHQGAPATLEPAIYEASPGTLAALVDAQRDAECLLLVGHNPGLEQLAALMHSGQSGDYRGCRRAASRCCACRWTPTSNPGSRRSPNSGGPDHPGGSRMSLFRLRAALAVAVLLLASGCPARGRATLPPAPRWRSMPRHRDRP